MNKLNTLNKHKELKTEGYGNEEVNAALCEHVTQDVEKEPNNANWLTVLNQNYPKG